MIKKEETSCWVIARAIFIGLILMIFIYWEVFVIIVLSIDCLNSSIGKPSNCTYNAVLIAGISCLTIYGILNLYVWAYVVSFYHSKSYKMEKENSGLVEQIASLERQLNQRARYIFVRQNNDVPPYTEENRPPNNEVNQAS